jgi:hypothetical protein
MNPYAKIVDQLIREFPAFSIVHKEDSLLMKTIDIIFKIFTFGKLGNFMTNFVTTIGEKVYVPTSWNALPEVARAITLRHERIHMLQKKRYGALVFFFKYLFWPMPFLFAKARRDYEMEAYEESMRARLELLGTSQFADPEYRHHMVLVFTGPSYLWMWRSKSDILDWYDDAMKRISSEDKRSN